MRASTNSITLKVTVPELAALLAEHKTDEGGVVAVDANDADADDWLRIEAGAAAGPTVRNPTQITEMDALMLVRVRGSTPAELLAVCQNYWVCPKADRILRRRAAELDASERSDASEEGGDPWCWQSLWRETTRLWHVTADHGPPPCCVS